MVRFQYILFAFVILLALQCLKTFTFAIKVSCKINLSYGLVIAASVSEYY
jgi:hypothetical protein